LAGVGEGAGAGVCTLTVTVWEPDVPPSPSSSVTLKLRGAVDGVAGIERHRAEPLLKHHHVTVEIPDHRINTRHQHLPSSSDPFAFSAWQGPAFTPAARTLCH